MIHPSYYITHNAVTSHLQRTSPLRPASRSSPPQVGVQKSQFISSRAEITRFPCITSPECRLHSVSASSSSFQVRGSRVGLMALNSIVLGLVYDRRARCWDEVSGQHGSLPALSNEDFGKQKVTGMARGPKMRS